MKKIILSISILFFGLMNAQTTNYAIKYNGSGDYIDVGPTVGSGVRSIEFWFKPAVTFNSSTSIPAYSFIVRNDNSQTHEYGIYLRGSDFSTAGNVGKMTFYVRYSGVDHEVYSNANSWTAGTWYHVAGVIDPTAGMMLYINGILQTSTDATATAATDVDNTNESYLGTFGNGLIRDFNGEMDEMRIWNRAISQSEIQTKMCQDLVVANETGLKAYWKFNEGSGTQAIDATTNGNTGVVTGATWVIDSPCSSTTGSYVINYNGSNNYIDVGAIVGSSIRSIEFWFKPAVTFNSSTTISAYSFIERNDNGQTHEYGIYLRGSDFSSAGNVGKMTFYVRYSGVNHEIYSNSSSWAAGTWYHVAGVIDATAGMMLYINGVLQTSTDATATAATDVDNTNESYLGTFGNALIRDYNGEMDEMRIWSRAISQNEIQTKMCQDLVVANETGLKAYWKFNEGSGTQAIDATTNGNTGVVTGATWLVDAYCTTTGIAANNTKQQTILIYPNPAKEILNLEMQDQVENSAYKIFNAIGQEVKSGIFSSISIQINLQHLSQGIYSIIVTQNDKVFISKIAIQK